MKCSRCDIESALSVYKDVKTGPVCMTCFLNEKADLMEQIEALPDVIDREPPLGYSFIVNRYFLDEEAGQAYADRVFWSFGGYR